MIEPVSSNNIDQVLPLIRLYQAFYHVKVVCDSDNRKFFSQFDIDNPLGCLFVARDDEQVIGFATVYFSFSSTLIQKVAVMNDLFVVPDYRGHGKGRELIEHCRYFARQRGAGRLQWVTAPDNRQAQQLYDATPARKSVWNFYAYDV
ncbi:GNAT family N-acetyltransferase [Echinimonas agarilytica]|uniref:GNAT family N-acetyltransferase n=1 Tax=Echinimonas agarilytica TaxID=1215918 RepID=A0AA41W5N0_9GAMM|nr:GNAT family N-acetyltransferase [Echinimonas agarilytica]MCM2679022.1 GNAT family N-acetyltransferase [Echinimonas agarilytica]